MAEHVSCEEVVELGPDARTVATAGRVTEEDVRPEARDRLVTAFRDRKRS